MKRPAIIIIGLIAALLAYLFLFKVAAPALLQARADYFQERTWKDTLFQFLSEDLKELEKKKIALEKKEIEKQEKQLDLENARIDSQKAMLPFYQDAKKYALLASVSVFLTAALVLSMAWSKRLSTHEIQLDEHVKFPVRNKDLKDSSSHVTAYLATKQAAALTDNRHEAFQMFVQLAQTAAALNRSLPSHGTAPATAALTSGQSAAGPVPAFRDILNALEPGDPMVLGFEQGSHKPITGGFKRIYSCGIFGVSGSGKTTGLYSIISQSLLLYPDIKYMVIDPHAQKKEGLTRGLPKTDHFEHLDHNNVRPGLTRFVQEMEARLKTGQDYSHAPRVLLIDELPVMMRGSQGQAVEAVLGRVAAEGRGVAVYALISGQDTRLKAAGGNRDLLTSQIAYNLKKKQARYLFDDSEIVDLHKAVRDAKEPGLCVFAATDDQPVIMKQPLCTPSDVLYVERLLVSNSTQDATFDSGRVTDDVTGGSQGDALETDSEDVTDVVTEEVHPFHDDPLLLQLDTFLQDEKNGLTKLGKMSDVNKGLLSLFHKGKRPLTDENRVKLQKTLDTVTPVVTEEKPSNVIPFLKKEPS